MICTVLNIWDQGTCRCMKMEMYGGAWHRATIAFVEKYVFISWFLTTWKYWCNETVDEILPVFAQVNSLNFEFYFLSFVPMGNCFQCYFRKLLNRYLALRKCKNHCKILKIILVPDFCPLKPKIARFSIAFRLNLLRPEIDIFELIQLYHP